MNEYRMAITEPDEHREPEEFRFHVSGRNVKIQWAIVRKSGVRDTQTIALDAWFDSDWLDAFGLDGDYRGGTFSIDTAREMWKYLHYRHSAESKQRRANRKETA